MGSGQHECGVIVSIALPIGEIIDEVEQQIDGLYGAIDEAERDADSESITQYRQQLDVLLPALEQFHKSTNDRFSRKARKVSAL